jgi:hypothetical protein
MRRVERASVIAPSSLTGPNRPGPNELERATNFFVKPRQYYANGTEKKFSFRAYKEGDVQHTLHELFHGKCAYCEARYEIVGPVDIEHYRPKGEVEGDAAHRGYWWLAAVWENLLPSCLDCNRRRYQPTPVEFTSLTAMAEPLRAGSFSSIKTGKNSCFPIEGPRVMTAPYPHDADRVIRGERALLLNPCVDHPRDHLTYWIDRRDHIGLVLPVAGGGTGPALPLLTEDAQAIIDHARTVGVSPRGAVSIQVYGLNRLALVQERTRLLRRLEFLGGIVVELFELAADLEDAAPSPGNMRDLVLKSAEKMRATAHRILAEIGEMSKPTAPFSEMVKQWTAVFISDL